LLLRTKPLNCYCIAKFSIRRNNKGEAPDSPKLDTMPTHPDTSAMRRGLGQPSPSARVQSLCAYTDMHRGHWWGATVISKWMVCSKRRSVFSHTQTVVHISDVKKFLRTQVRTGRHIVEACPQPQPNSFTRLSRLTAVYVSE